MAGNTYRNLQRLTENNLETSVKSIFSISKSKKVRYVDYKSNHIFLRVDVDDDDYGKINMEDWNGAVVRESTHIIISDYNKGFIGEDDIIQIANMNPTATIYLDTKKLLTENILKSVNFVKINETELINNRANPIWERLHSKYSEKIIITLGAKGTNWNNHTYPVLKASNTIDVSGAGDTFMAAFCIDHSKYDNVVQAINYANLAASLVVTKRGVRTILKKYAFTWGNEIVWVTLSQVHLRL
jgi:bifunctional ADP-heptose synthase (sugar kinase/adenylyltransferase)